MRKTIKIFMGLFILGALSVFGQSSPVGKINAQEIPQERVFIHHNTTLLLAGEYLYYKVYCRNAETKATSPISKIAYVELIGEYGESVFLHKIFLEKGRGQGDFFVPVSVESGNYKLIGYTQWMKNQGADQFFQGDVSIVNPYRSDQTPLLATANDPLLKENPERGVIEANSGQRKKIGILSLNDSVFGHRKKVQLTLRAEPGSSIKGDYSLSVRKTDSFITPRMISSKDFDASASKKTANMDGTLYIPEMRGDLVSGKIIPKNGNQAQKNIKVALSIPGEADMTKVATSDDGGAFYLNLDKHYTSNEAIFQILGKGKDGYNVVIDQEVSSGNSNLSFYHFDLVPQMEDALLKRSVHNQIENAYFSVKPDTLVTAESSKPDYWDRMDIYDLDDYTRFPTLRETLVEIIEHVYSRRVAGEEYEIKVRNYMYDTHIPPNAEPLVLVDGILVQDHTFLLNYDARKIKSIGVLRDKYILSLQIFQGVVFMETIDGDFSLPDTNDFTITQELAKPLERKKYFSPVYGDSLSEQVRRIPDFRYQLFWKPDVVVSGKESLFSFYTSDIKGEFEISLEGFTIEGKPISMTESFWVE